MGIEKVIFMHTIKGNNKHTTFHFDGDFDGHVIIKRHPDLGEQQEMHVPMEALKVFFAEYLRRQKIAKIETMSDESIIEQAIKSL